MWSTEEIEGIRIERFTPSTVREGPPVIMFHSRRMGDWGADPFWERELDRLGLTAACPHFGEGWWPAVSQLDQPDDPAPLTRLVDSIIPKMLSPGVTAASPVALFGIESGGAAAIGLAYRHARRFPIVATIQPAVDFQRLIGTGTELDRYFSSVEEARQQTAILHLHPLDWPRHQWLASHPLDLWHEGCERLLSKLDSIGIPCARVIDHSAGSPEEFVSQQARTALEFIAASSSGIGG